MREVGIIGLGLLGGAMAHRLLQTGHSVQGFDVDPQRCAEFSAEGGHVCGSAAEVVRQCEFVLLSLPDSTIVQRVMNQLRPHARGRLIVDTTTGDPDDTARLGAELVTAGIEYCDATVVGSSQLARDGRTTLLVGGTAAAVQQVQPLLDDLGERWFHLGPCGHGARAKLVVNLVLGLNRAVLAEGLSLARQMGLELPQILEVLRCGAAYSKVMDAKGRKMIDRDFAPEARLRQHRKDVGLILEQGRRRDAYLPLSQVHALVLSVAERSGWGEADNSAIAAVFDASDLRQISESLSAIAAERDAQEERPQ